MMERPSTLSPTDRALAAIDQGLRTIFGRTHARRPIPMPADRPSATDQAGRDEGVAPPLSDDERRLAGALMRVNHVGEVCAQALYQAQALTARTPELRAKMLSAAQEETDHLAWTRQRLDQLGERPSLLNPVWYAGSFLIGLAAGRAGDAVSLGFVVETERQVEKHLAGHLQRLPPHDAVSRAIVEQMRQDEMRHGQEAREAGAADLPPPVQALMRGAARVMTTAAHRI